MTKEETNNIISLVGRISSVEANIINLCDIVEKQGIVDKAALQNYTTPPGTTKWTVFTN